jgi:hypothetical protein
MSKINKLDREYLIRGFSDYGFSELKISDWFGENESYLNSELMKRVYEDPHEFFSAETNPSSNEDFLRLKSALEGEIVEVGEAIDSGKKLKFETTVVSDSDS